MRFVYKSIKADVKSCSVGVLLINLLRELDIKHKSGDHYTPYFNTELNHPIALAREIVAFHHDDQLTDFQNAKPIRQNDKCILNYIANYSSDTDRGGEVQLIKYMATYASTQFRYFKLGNSNKTKLISYLKATFPPNESDTIWNWFEREVLKSKHPTNIGKSALVNVPGFTVAPTRVTDHVCPPLSNQVSTIIEKHLSNDTTFAVESRLMLFPLDQRTDKLIGEIRHVVKEFVHHVPNWESVDCKITAAKLQSLSGYTGPLPQGPTFNAMLRVVHDVISQLRQRLENKGKTSAKPKIAKKD